MHFEKSQNVDWLLLILLTYISITLEVMKHTFPINVIVNHGTCGIPLTDNFRPSDLLHGFSSYRQNMRLWWFLSHFLTELILRGWHSHGWISPILFCHLVTYILVTFHLDRSKTSSPIPSMYVTRWPPMAPACMSQDGRRWHSRLTHDFVTPICQKVLNIKNHNRICAYNFSMKELKPWTPDIPAVLSLYGFKERGGGQNFSTSFWMRFSQAPYVDSNLFSMTLSFYFREIF